MIARREQQARGGAPQAHGKKIHRTLKETAEVPCLLDPRRRERRGEEPAPPLRVCGAGLRSYGRGAEGGGAGGAEDRREDPGAGGRGV